MGNPLNDGRGTTAHSDKITISGKIPAEFLEAIRKMKKWVIGAWRETPFKVSEKPLDWDADNPTGFTGHPFASPTAVIPRVFRFTVETDLDTKFQYYVQDLYMDFTNKQLKMALYETSDFYVDEVLNAYNNHKPDKPLTVVLYDGCGKKIMAYRFHGVALHTYSAKLDYASNDALSPKAVFKYDRYETLKRPN